MSLERWAQIEKLFHLAVECKPSRRPAFLDELCGGDQELRREVESLLARERGAETFLQGAARGADDSLRIAEPGGVAGPQDFQGTERFLIQDRLGSGGFLQCQSKGKLMMRRYVRTASPGIAILLFLQPIVAQAPSPKPLTLPLECASGDCPLLRGAPQTAGLRSGSVRLKPGETVGWHTTGQHEEALVILRGGGEARIEGQ